MKEIEKRIIIRAASIRIQNGEDREKVIDSYTKLSDEEKEEIRNLL